MLKRILYYITAVLLITVYVCILFRSFDTSGTAREYRMYYLDRTLQYYRPGFDLDEYTVNELYEYRAGGRYLNQGTGWYVLSEDGTWNPADKLSFYIYVPEPEKDYELRINIAETGGYRHDLWINDELYAPFDIDVGENVIEVKSGALAKGTNTFAVITDEDMRRGDELYSNLKVISVGLFEKEK